MSISKCRASAWLSLKNPSLLITPLQPTSPLKGKPKDMAIGLADKSTPILKAPIPHWYPFSLTHDASCCYLSSQSVRLKWIMLFYVNRCFFRQIHFLTKQNFFYLTALTFDEWVINRHFEARTLIRLKTWVAFFVKVPIRRETPREPANWIGAKM